MLALRYAALAAGVLAVLCFPPVAEPWVSDLVPRWLPQVLFAVFGTAAIVCLIYSIPQVIGKDQK